MAADRRRTRSSFDVRLLSSDGDFDEDEEGLSTGRMSVWFAAYTLACSQIGSSLVGVSAFFAGSGELEGVIQASVLGVMTLLAVYYISHVWIRTRQAQLRTKLHVSEGSSLIPPATPDVEAARQVPSNSGGRLMYVDLISHAMQYRFGKGSRSLWWVGVMVKVTAVMQVISLCGTAVSEVIQTGVNMYVVTGYQNPRYWAAMMGGAVMTPLVWLPSFESLSWLSLLAILAVVYTAATVVAETMGVPALAGVPPPDPTLTSAFVSFSDFVFIWGGLAMVPEVQSSMRRPRRLFVSFAMDLVYTLAVLIPTGVFGLAVYQSSASSNILRQLPPNIGTKVAAAFLSLHMVIAYAVLLAAVLEGAERLVGLRRRGPGPGERQNARRKWHVSPGMRAKRLLLRTAISAMCVLVALAFPFFSDVVGVVSAITQTFLSYLAPPFMWLCMEWDSPDSGDGGRTSSSAAALHMSAKSQRSQHGSRSSCGHRLKVFGALGMMAVMLCLGLGLGTWASGYTLVQKVGTFGLFDPNL